MKQIVRFPGLAVLAALLSGCVGPGARHELPLVMPDGERATIVVHNQMVPDWMLDRNKLAMNYIVDGIVSEKQKAAVARVETECRIFAGYAQPNNLVAIGMDGVLFGVTGYIGGSLAAGAFGQPAHVYGRYAGTFGAISGTANGIISVAGQTYAFQACNQAALEVFKRYGVRPITNGMRY